MARSLTETSSYLSEAHGCEADDAAAHAYRDIEATHVLLGVQLRKSTFRFLKGERHGRVF